MRELKHRLAQGEVLQGAVINIVHTSLIEVVCAAGADFLFIDFEHGLRDYSEIAGALMAAEVRGVPALVRLGERSANLTARMLDAGATGFLFSQVSNAAEAAELVSWCRYKPTGVRGSGFARASLRHENIEHERRSHANDDVVCIMIVESLKGKSNLAEILAVDGVTGVAIGPGDISLELGCADWNDPRVVQALSEMADVTKGFPDRALLQLALTPVEAEAHVQNGANMILLNHDTSLIKSMYAELFQSNSMKISKTNSSA